MWLADGRLLNCILPYWFFAKLNGHKILMLYFKLLQKLKQDITIPMYVIQLSSIHYFNMHMFINSIPGTLGN